MKTDDDGDVDFQNNDIEVINAGLLSCCFRFRAMTSTRTHITSDTTMSVKDSWVQLLYLIKFQEYNALWGGTVLKNDGTVKGAVRWVRWYGTVGTVGYTVRWVRWVRYGGYGGYGTVGTLGTVQWVQWVWYGGYGGTVRWVRWVRYGG